MRLSFCVPCHFVGNTCMSPPAPHWLYLRCPPPLSLPALLREAYNKDEADQEARLHEHLYSDNWCVRSQTSMCARANRLLLWS